MAIPRSFWNSGDVLSHGETQKNDIYYISQRQQVRMLKFSENLKHIHFITWVKLEVKWHFALKSSSDIAILEHGTTEESLKLKKNIKKINA